MRISRNKTSIFYAFYITYNTFPHIKNIPASNAEFSHIQKDGFSTQTVAIHYTIYVQGNLLHPYLFARYSFASFKSIFALCPCCF